MFFFKISNYMNWSYCYCYIQLLKFILQIQSLAINFCFCILSAYNGTYSRKTYISSNFFYYWYFYRIRIRLHYKCVFIKLYLIIAETYLPFNLTIPKNSFQCLSMHKTKKTLYPFTLYNLKMNTQKPKEEPFMYHI